MLIKTFTFGGMKLGRTGFDRWRDDGRPSTKSPVRDAHGFDHNEPAVDGPKAGMFPLYHYNVEERDFHKAKL